MRPTLEWVYALIVINIRATVFIRLKAEVQTEGDRLRGHTPTPLLIEGKMGVRLKFRLKADG